MVPMIQKHCFILVYFITITTQSIFMHQQQTGHGFLEEHGLKHKYVIIIISLVF